MEKSSRKGGGLANGAGVEKLWFSVKSLALQPEGPGPSPDTVSGARRPLPQASADPSLKG